MKKYYIITIGCQMNKSDSERIANYLENLGYVRAEKEKSADIIVYTTCGVRQSAEDRVYGLLPRIKKDNPESQIILTGCLVNRKDVRRRLEGHVDIWMPITELSGLSEKLNNKKAGDDNSSLSGYLNLRPKYESKFSAFVPIGNGCDNFCTYCVVPHARGRETYRPAEEIIAEVKNLISAGYKEIILIAQNVNSYSSPLPSNSPLLIRRGDGGEVNFSDLLRTINELVGDYWLRFSTSHPKDMSDQLIETIAECDKICRHIHLPAQSGDNEILAAMNRKYTREHYLELIEKIKNNLTAEPDSTLIRAGALGSRGSIYKSGKTWGMPASITTDIIVGFPGETEEQFLNTAKLFEEAKFDMAYIAQYSPRPGTASYKMKDDVPKQEKKRREEELMKILRRTSKENNEEYVGKVVGVIVEEKKDDFYFGKTATSKAVKFQIPGENPDDILGKFVKVKIIEAGDFGLKGEVIEISR